MCKKGNQTIYQQCRETIRHQAGKKTLSNQEMRATLKQIGGDFPCRNGKDGPD